MSDTVIVDDGILLVGEDRGNRGLLLGLGAIGLSGVLLFAVLEASRQSNATPQIAPPKDYAYATAPRPELAMPLVYEAAFSITQETNQPEAVALPAEPKLPPVPLTRISPPAAPTPAPAPYQQQPPPVNAPQLAPQVTTPDPGRAAPAIVYDALQAALSNAAEAGTKTGQASKANAVGGGDRSNLVSQGTLIYAVLETALNSTQAGQARAMISSNVYNAVGTKILIPKGSRVFGEYKADIGAGQNRAQIIWSRLVRSDGATIALDSPASDQLGRAGVKGSVDSHFGERLLNALLQSTIDFGAAVAGRAVSGNNGVIIALPNATQSAASQLVQDVPKPTLKVRHGTRIAVFVARDLDFSAVE
jgi:type IV secretion system protein VirB10